MPCSDGGYGYEQQEREKSSKVAAALCAILSMLEEDNILQDILEYCNWKEAGITQAWVEYWWEEHKAADKARKEQERRWAEKEARAAKALTKLTAEEREALGL